MNKYFVGYHSRGQGRDKPVIRLGLGKNLGIQMQTVSEYDGFEEVKQVQICKSTQDTQALNELRIKYKALSLKKIMAVELAKDRVKGDLRRIVQQIDSQVHSGRQDFVVLGGGPKSLHFQKYPCTTTSRSRRKQNYGKKAEDLDIICPANFTLHVDVRGYMPNNVVVHTSNNHMSIRAVKVNGAEKALGLLAPSTAHLEKVKIFPPTNGVLILKYPHDDPSDDHIDEESPQPQPQ